MTDSKNSATPLDDFDRAAFTIASLDDEIRADHLLQGLVRRFFDDQVAGQKELAEEAGRNARGVDYFFREFIIGERRENIFDTTAQRVRQFAGNWYIIRNLEPNLAELGDILDGVAAFFHYLQTQNLVSAQVSTEITTACADLDYYRQRIEDFWAIEGDGYQVWAEKCPLSSN